jgi:OOP family OmpA-OmpF porin
MELASCVHRYPLIIGDTMQFTPFVPAALVALAFAAITPAYAQTQPGTPSGTSAPSASDSNWRMPYQKDFWGYVGGAIGQSDYDLSSCGGCDDTKFGYKIFAGGRVKNIFGAEIGFVDLGKVKFSNGGDARTRGVNLSLVANMPIDMHAGGATAGLFAKVGTIYSGANTNGIGPVLLADKDNGFDLTYGLGGTLGINRNWQVRLDWDRYRLDYNGGRSNSDLYTVGLQYHF